ncbi:MAG: hemerythrin domain-containing protein [Alphaproteobacteria bacterium]|nr:MAG: hemerythrin domain-containing protein [Alphaproteobacteria bacterium]
MKVFMKNRTFKEMFTGRKNVLDMLEQDHKEIMGLFKTFRKMTEEGAPPSEKDALVKKACAALLLHTRLEEEIFYPAVRRAAGGNDMLDEAMVEHSQARAHIDELLEMLPGEALHDAKFIVLGEHIRNHIREEEDQIFPMAEDYNVNLDAIGREMEKRRAEIEEEMGAAVFDEKSIPLVSAYEKTRMTDEGGIV